jgi:hypothetical protein
MAKKLTRAELEAECTRLAAENGAMAEWIWSEAREASDTLDVDAPDIGTRYRVTVRGLFRQAGGVATVTDLDPDAAHAGLPEYLETLIARWSRSHSPYLQHAASKLRAHQTKAIKARLAG